MLLSLLSGVKANTPLGKITVTKAFLVSHLTYILMALPGPLDEFLTELHIIGQGFSQIHMEQQTRLSSKK